MNKLIDFQERMLLGGIAIGCWSLFGDKGWLRHEAGAYLLGAAQ